MTKFSKKVQELFNADKEANNQLEEKEKFYISMSSRKKPSSKT